MAGNLPHCGTRIYEDRYRIPYDKEKWNKRKGILMKFNKTIIRIVSMVLCISMLSTASMQTFAAANVGAGQDQEVYLEIGDTRIDYYETEEGDQVFLEYINGVLTQRNTIPAGQEDIVVREFLNTEENRIAGSGNTDVIHPSDYIISEEGEEVELPSPRKEWGQLDIDHRIIRALYTTG